VYLSIHSPRITLDSVDIVEVTMKGKVDPVTGMVINIKDLKECLQIVIENLDHRNLDKDVEFFFSIPSTTENLAIYIWNEFQKLYTSHANAPVCSARLYRVKICETDNNHVEYMGEETSD
jgi:6-pyruvoyltetrahydropterin/6-carboxytetrahydropterin synthase